MRKYDGQQGFVSLMTTILLSLLLLVITLSMVTLEALQLRKAEDAEQTLRAYYTAESGVEDAVGKVLSKGTGAASTCNALTTFDVKGDSGWTCQQISFTGNPTGRLESPDLAQTIDPYCATGDPTCSSPNYQSVIVEFSLDNNTTTCYYLWSCATSAPWASAANNFPSQAQFAGGPKAAPIELSMVQYPHNGFSSNAVCTNYSGSWQPAGCEVKLQNAVIVPGGGAGGGGGPNYGSPMSTQTQPFTARCNAGAAAWNLHTWQAGLAGNGPEQLNSYHCAAVITNLANNCGGGGGGCDYLFRIRSRFAGSAYKFIFMSSPNGKGNAVQVQTGSALIDVTARAGQTYRRVISRMPLTGEASGSLNYVMYSDTDICKNFTVINNIVQHPGCPYVP